MQAKPRDSRETEGPAFQGGIRNLDAPHTPGSDLVDRLTPRTLLILLALGLALAGCTNKGSDTTSSTPPTAVNSTAQAQSLLMAALQSPPSRFSVEMGFWHGTQEVATSKATYLNESGETYLVASGALLNQLKALGVSADEVAIYKGPTGFAVTTNGTTLVLPPESQGGQSTALMGQARNSGLAPFLSGPGALAYLQGEQVQVKSVEPTTCNGEPATRVTFNHTVQAQENVATADVLAGSPPRLCHLETSLPTRANAQADPLNGANVRADFRYESEVAAIPADAKAPLGLLYQKSSATDPKHQVWTFQGASGRTPAQVSIEVKDASAASGSAGFGFVNYAAMPTAWSASLDQLPKTQDGVTLAFADNDHDGKVSAGDTLTLDTTGDQLPPVLLKDLATGTYVVPGPGALAGLAVLGVAALLLRRHGPQA